MHLLTELEGNGRFQKISIPYHGRPFGIPRASGGFFELDIRRHGGILTIGILKAWGGFLDLGFPRETDKSVFLEKANFMDF